jgi:hypothetical protein
MGIGSHPEGERNEKQTKDGVKTMKRVVAICCVFAMFGATFALAQDPPKSLAQKVEDGTRVEILQGNPITGDPTVQTGVAYVWNSDFDEVGWAATVYTTVLDLSEIAGIPLAAGAGTLFPEEWNRVVPAAFLNWKANLYKWESLTDVLTKLVPILDSEDLTFDIGVTCGYDKLSDEGSNDWLFGVATSLSVSF